MLDSAMQAMIDQAAQPASQGPSRKSDKDEGRTVAALQTMIEWLTQRPSLLLSKRLLDLLKGLHNSNRNSVLIEITHATTEKVIKYSYTFKRKVPFCQNGTSTKKCQKSLVPISPKLNFSCYCSEV